MSEYIKSMEGSIYRVHELTEAQELAATLLSPEQRAGLENELARLTDALANTKFDAMTAGGVDAAILAFTYQQGRREVILSLLTDSADAYTRLAADPTRK